MRSWLRRLLTLTRTEWTLREQSTLSGFLWTLLYPALLFATLWLLFSRWLGRAPSDYAFFLLVGLLQWNYFSVCTGTALSALVRRSPMLRNFALPLELPALASALSVTASHLIEMGLLLSFLLVFGPAPSIRWLLIVPVELLLIALTLGVSLCLCWLQVLSRDTERIWAAVSVCGFFLTPVFYDAALLPEPVGALLSAHPVASILAASRWALLGRGAPPAGLLGAAVCAGAFGALGLHLLRARAGAVRDGLA